MSNTPVHLVFVLAALGAYVYAVLRVRSELDAVRASTVWRRGITLLAGAALALDFGYELAGWPIIVVVPSLLVLAIYLMPTGVKARLFHGDDRVALRDDWIELQRMILTGDRSEQALARVDVLAADLDRRRTAASDLLVDLAQAEARDWIRDARQPAEDAERDGQSRHEAKLLFGSLPRPGPRERR